jgi:hypothetical protein
MEGDDAPVTICCCGYHAGGQLAAEYGGRGVGSITQRVAGCVAQRVAGSIAGRVTGRVAGVGDPAHEPGSPSARVEPRRRPRLPGRPVAVHHIPDHAVRHRKLPLEKWDAKISWRWLEKGEVTCPSGVEGCYGLLVKARKACPKGVVVKLIVRDENGREVDILRKSIKKLAKGKQEALVISTQKPAADKAYVDSIVCR